jgi:alkylhydroperoxidase family enzyme
MAIDDAGWDGTNGRAAFARAEPELAVIWQQLEAGFWRATRPDLADLVRRTAAAATGLAPLPVPADVVDGRPVEQWRTSGAFSDKERTVLGFAEQFSLDVSATDDAQRAALTSALGDDTFGFVQVLYVADFAPRVRAALDALFGPSDAVTTTPSGDDRGPVDLWPLLEQFITIVGPLDTVDVVTRELVLLRGARQHQCRLCQSLRSRSAIAAGADDALFDAVDHPDRPIVNDRRRAAFALVDDMIWQPSRIAPATVTAVRTHYTPLEAVHLVLNVARNSIQKVPVALATDGANVTDGVEIYDINPDGSLSYGLAAPVPG